MGIFLIIVIFSISAFLRFYGLTWGGDLFFHPDERNIANTVAQLRFPDQMNPHFFAYGGFPLYIIYFTGLLINILIQKMPASIILFDEAIIISRFYSALVSILIIFPIYFAMVELKNKKAAAWTVFLVVTSVGFVQFAHFGTFEMWLTFFSILFFYFCLKTLKTDKILYLIFSGLTFGLLVSTKISSLILLPIYPLVIYLHLKRTLFIKKILARLSLFLATGLLAFSITSPFALFDWSAFLSAIKYESSIALGTLPVFYTGEFYSTMPILFQFFQIYPFLLNPVITALFVPAITYVIFIAFKEKKRSYFLLLFFYFLLFLPQSFLFAKWTRYMTPTLPFAYIIIVIAIFKFNTRLRTLILSLITLIACVFTISYFTTVYTKPDSRISASLWAKENIPRDSKILSEVYDLGITPFNQYFPNITLFNFYELGDKSSLPPLLSQTDYIILPSQRIMKRGYSFYQSLFDGRLGFDKVYQTPCDFFCKVSYLGDPVFNLEETTNVFDRPIVFIFKKNEN